VPQAATRRFGAAPPALGSSCGISQPFRAGLNLACGPPGLGPISGSLPVITQTLTSGSFSAVPTGLNLERLVYAVMTRAPEGPAMIATEAKPRNSPCSTTPVMVLMVWPTAAGSMISP
jgi:hypothetical protein